MAPTLPPAVRRVQTASAARARVVGLYDPSPSTAAEARAPLSGARCVAARVEVFAVPPPPAVERSLGVVTFAWDFVVDLGREGAALVPRVELVVEPAAEAGELVALDPCPPELLPLVARAPLGARALARETVLAVGDEVSLEGELRPLPASPGGPALVVASPRVRPTR